jgi:hypothetical protein
LTIHRSPAISRSFSLAVLAIAGAVLASACAGSGFDFASSADGQAYFRVPSNWHVYTTQQMLRAQELHSPGAASEIKWVVGYDASPHPSIQHVLEPVTDAPIVYAFQRDLSPAERDGISLGALRNILYNVDQGVQQGSITLISADDELSLGKDFFGNRYVFDIVLHSGAASTTVRVEQTAALDAGVHHLYVQEVACSADCFTANQHLIDQIVSSWTLKNR